ncbi:MAG TPA: nitronate monooxygenase [Allosphingosinicella sp.]|nr:nitronate monooxygenase [Allosphingosinicella sp.]
MSFWPDRRFADLLGSRWPIIAAPMAGAAAVDLAVAVIQGGGVGSLPCAMLTPERAHAQVAAVRQQAEGPLNLNFFCHVMPDGADDSAWRALLAPLYARARVAAGDAPPSRLPFDAAMCAVVEEVRPELVSFHFGLPDEALLARVRASGSRILGNATSVAEARWLAARGIDAIVAQGWEAGGHAGAFLGGDPAERIGLFALIPQIADAVAVPVIAAGGIGDARGIAAALTLGAAAVQLGTAYLFCPESPIGATHRDGLAGEAAAHTAFTNVFSGGLGRGLPGPLTDALGRVRDEAPPFPLASAALAPLGLKPMWAGQAAALGRPEPARALTERLGREALALLAGSG